MRDIFRFTFFIFIGIMTIVGVVALYIFSASAAVEWFSIRYGTIAGNFAEFAFIILALSLFIATMFKISITVDEKDREEREKKF